MPKLNKNGKFGKFVRNLFNELKIELLVILLATPIIAVFNALGEGLPLPSARDFLIYIASTKLPIWTLIVALLVLTLTKLLIDEFKKVRFQYNKRSIVEDRQLFEKIQAILSPEIVDFYRNPKPRIHQDVFAPLDKIDSIQHQPYLEFLNPRIESEFKELVAAITELTNWSIGAFFPSERDENYYEILRELKFAQPSLYSATVCLFR